MTRDGKLLADVADPDGDDQGRAGNYRYPTDASWAGATADLRQRARSRAPAARCGSACAWARSARRWNPPNGFDHVAFNVYVATAGRGRRRRGDAAAERRAAGRHALALPPARHGWSNALFAADGATAPRPTAAPATPAAGIEVDADERTRPLHLLRRRRSAAGSLSGARVYVNTWDYDGGYRPLTPAAGRRHASAAATAPRDPLVMDETGVIVLP